MLTYEELHAERTEVAYFMRRLYKQGLTTCSGGNLSKRVDGDRFIITASAVDKGEIMPEHIAMFTMKGENLTPHLKGSIETEMHRRIFEARPDISAIVHAHPVTATAFAAMDMEINGCLTAEAYAVLGKLSRASYCMMGTDGLADCVADCLKSFDVSVMQNHGVITVGKTMLAAFDKLEVLENAAKMTWITHTMNNVRPLSETQRKEIADSFWK